MQKVSAPASRAKTSSRSRAGGKSPETRSSGSRTVAAKLDKLEIRGEFDLVLHLPLRYEDETRITAIARAPPGVPVQVEGTVRSTEDQKTLTELTPAAFSSSRAS